MTRRRFIADEFSHDRAALIGEHADHLARVLRARVGQEFDVAAGSTVRRGKILSVSNARVEFELGDELSSQASTEITLALSIFKFDRMEWAIEKCTELGVSRIIPLIARRTDAHLASASAKRVERWQRIVRQASEQSRRAVPPEIAAPVRLSEIFSLQSGLRIVLSESEDRTLLHDAVKSTAADGVLFAVGPEGGWADDELQSFQQADWTSASLGNTILRAETAAIAATAIVTSALASL
jgi:16S rRNA (uracil1498-N3)-methyltransferase